MTNSPDIDATVNPTTTARKRFPFLGLAALIAGAIAPVWAILAAVTGGLEAVAWIPVILLFFFPIYIIFYALLIFAVLCGIFAIRDGGTNRRLGWIGLILAGVQLVAAIAYMVWAFSDILFGR